MPFTLGGSPAAPAVVALSLAWTGGFGCGKTGPSLGDEPRAGSRSDAAATAATAPGANGGACGHAACGDHFFVDAVPPSDCRSGAPCEMSVALVALGDFHVNDEYPYRFIADPRPLVQFVGTDPSGQSVFSKAAGDWRKGDAKRGAMTVRFFVSTPSNYVISGTFKLSICSGAVCLLEQRPVSATFTAQ